MIKFFRLLAVHVCSNQLHMDADNSENELVFITDWNELNRLSENLTNKSNLVSSFISAELSLGAFR